MERKILALTRYGEGAASTRQRFALFAPALAEAGFSLSIAPFFDDNDTDTINRGDKIGLSRLAQAYARRVRAVIAAREADIAWVQYELFPFLPAIAERLLSASGKPVIVDYDDAYYLRYDLHPRSLVRQVLAKKVAPLVSSAAVVVAGNDRLACHLSEWNERVHVIPTVVDTDRYTVRQHQEGGRMTIGWIGSPSTWAAYVRPWLSTIESVCQRTGSRFLVLGANPSREDLFEEMDVREWNEHSEIGDVQEMDIGIMPLPDDEWARGKCGYKLIQYMACGLPTVASPVGVNCAIVTDEQDGLFASNAAEWSQALEKLLCDAELRQRFGDHGRKRVMRDYSLASQSTHLVNLFNQVLG